MSTRATVAVSFDAASATEAADRVAGWTLHEGCDVSVAYTDASEPLETGQDGKPKKKPKPPKP